MTPGALAAAGRGWARVRREHPAFAGCAEAVGVVALLAVLQGALGPVLRGPAWEVLLWVLVAGGRPAAFKLWSAIVVAVGAASLGGWPLGVGAAAMGGAMAGGALAVGALAEERWSPRHAVFAAGAVLGAAFGHLLAGTGGLGVAALLAEAVRVGSSLLLVLLGGFGIAVGRAAWQARAERRAAGAVRRAAA